MTWRPTKEEWDTFCQVQRHVAETFASLSVAYTNERINTLEEKMTELIKSYDGARGAYAELRDKVTKQTETINALLQKEVHQDGQQDKAD